MSFLLSRVASLSTAILLALLTVLALGCEPEQGAGTIHPVEERVPHYSDTDHTIQTDALAGKGLPAQLRDAWDSRVHTVGVQEESGPELFGEIDALVAGPDGRMFVLDGENKEVRVFGADGSHRTSFGREGEAPGEFQYPDHMVLFEDSTLTVIGRSGRVQYFGIADEAFERIGGFRVEFTPEDACILGDRLYLHGNLAQAADHSIHVYSRSGDHLRSFGPVYDSDWEVIRQTMSGGDIACEQESGMVAFAFTYMPIVYGYTQRGTLNWTSRLRPFTPVPNEERVDDEGRRGMSHHWDPGTDIVLNLVDVPGVGVLAQRRTFPPDDAGDGAAPVHTYWVSGPDGDGTYVGESTVSGDRVGPVAYATSDRIFSARRYPFPRIDVYDVTGVDWSLGVAGD